MAKRIGGRNGNPALGRLVQQSPPVRAIGHIPPAKAEANNYATIDNLDMVALLKRNCLQKTRAASLARIPPPDKHSDKIADEALKPLIKRLGYHSLAHL